MNDLNAHNVYAFVPGSQASVCPFYDNAEVAVNNEVEDKVNHPKHYTSHPSGIECIEITKWYDFCIGNCIKYIWRAGLKKSATLSDKEKELEDLKKARWYLDKEIQEKEKELQK